MHNTKPHCDTNDITILPIARHKKKYMLRIVQHNGGNGGGDGDVSLSFVTDVSGVRSREVK